MKLSPNEQRILLYLRAKKATWPKMVSLTQIGLELHRRGSSWARPVCLRLLEKKLVHRSEEGCYGLSPQGAEVARNHWQGPPKKCPLKTAAKAASTSFRKGDNGKKYSVISGSGNYSIGLPKGFGPLQEGGVEVGGDVVADVMVPTEDFNEMQRRLKAMRCALKWWLGTPGGNHDAVFPDIAEAALRGEIKEPNNG